MPKQHSSDSSGDTVRILSIADKLWGNSLNGYILKGSSYNRGQYPVFCSTRPIYDGLSICHHLVHNVITNCKTNAALSGREGISLHILDAVSLMKDIVNQMQKCFDTADVICRQNLSVPLNISHFGVITIDDNIVKHLDQLYLSDFVGYIFRGFNIAAVLMIQHIMTIRLIFSDDGKPIIKGRINLQQTDDISSEDDCILLPDIITSPIINKDFDEHVSLFEERMYLDRAHNFLSKTYDDISKTHDKFKRITDKNESVEGLKPISNLKSVSKVVKAPSLDKPNKSLEDRYYGADDHGPYKTDSTYSLLDIALTITVATKSFSDATKIHKSTQPRHKLVRKISEMIAADDDHIIMNRVKFCDVDRKDINMEILNLYNIGCRIFTGLGKSFSDINREIKYAQAISEMISNLAKQLLTSLAAIIEDPSTITNAGNLIAGFVASYKLICVNEIITNKRLQHNCFKNSSRVSSYIIGDEAGWSSVNTLAARSKEVFTYLIRSKGVDKPDDDLKWTFQFVEMCASINVVSVFRYSYEHIIDRVIPLKITCDNVLISCIAATSSKTFSTDMILTIAKNNDLKGLIDLIHRVVGGNPSMDRISVSFMFDKTPTLAMSIVYACGKQGLVDVNLQMDEYESNHYYTHRFNNLSTLSPLIAKKKSDKPTAILKKSKSIETKNKYDTLAIDDSDGEKPSYTAAVKTKPTIATKSVSSKVSEKVPSKVSEKVPSKVSEKVPSKVSEKVLSKVSEKVPSKVSEKVSSKVSEKALAKVSTNLDLINELRSSEIDMLSL